MKMVEGSRSKVGKGKEKAELWKGGIKGEGRGFWKNERERRKGEGKGGEEKRTTKNYYRSKSKLLSPPMDLHVG
jgi:hypothetical protein